MVDEEEKTKFSPPHMATVWGRVNLWHAFSGDTTTEFSSVNGFVPFTSDLEETWIEIGVGASRQVSDKTTVYGNVNFETTFDGDTYAFNGKIGLRVNW